jgi:hypothetical protein
MNIYYWIRNELLVNKNLAAIHLECYICGEVGHKCLDCGSFTSVKQGNLIKLYNQVYKDEAGFVEGKFQKEVEAQGEG